MQRFYSGDLTIRIEVNPNKARDIYGKPCYRGYISGPTNAGQLNGRKPRWRWSFDDLRGHGGLKAQAASIVGFGWSGCAPLEITAEIENGCITDEDGEVIVTTNYRYRWGGQD